MIEAEPKCYSCGTALEVDGHGNQEWCPKCEPAIRIEPICALPRRAKRGRSW